MIEKWEKVYEIHEKVYEKHKKVYVKFEDGRCISIFNRCDLADWSVLDLI